MNTRKLTVILIAVAFSLIVVFSCVAIFSVKKVEVDYAVAEETNVAEIQQTLNGYLGKNLLFLNEEDVIDALKDFHYMKVLSVSKSFPNVLKVQLEERREIYHVTSSEKVYITTAEGFVLDCIDKAEYQGNAERDKITMVISEIDPTNGVEKHASLSGTAIAQNLSITGDEFLSQVFDMAKAVHLTNCIKEIKVERIAHESFVAGRDVLITTYTGVKIRIKNADKNGLEKIEQAFSSYDKSSTDYKKTFDYIIAIDLEINGESLINITWSPKDNSPLNSGQA